MPKHFYDAKLEQLNVQLTSLMQLQQEETAAAAAARRMQDVLRRMLVHSTAVLHFLEAVQQQQQHSTSAQAPPAAAGAADSLVQPTPVPLAAGELKHSYSLQLLHSIRWRDVAAVRAMTVPDWCRHFEQLFARLSMLLELTSRSVPAPADAAAAVSSAADPGAPSQQAAATPLQGWPAKLGASRGGDMQHLDGAVDYMMRMAMAALLFNPLPLFAASALNLATGEPATPPPGLFAQVAARVAISAEQAAVLRVVNAQFARLQQQAVAQRAALAQQATVTGVAALAAAATTKEGSAASGEGDGFELERQLRSHLLGIQQPTLLLVMASLEVLTKVQLATLNVAAFPFVVTPGDALL